MSEQELVIVRLDPEEYDKFESCIPPVNRFQFQSFMDENQIPHLFFPGWRMIVCPSLKKT